MATDLTDLLARNGFTKHSIQHRCPNMESHVTIRFKPVPVPCDECYSVEIFSRPLPYQESMKEDLS